jgi:hypothetical protein
MRNRLPMGVAVMLLTIVAGGARAVLAAEHNHLAELAARQGLRDEVCFAMADGQISRLERYIILSDAKRVLKPEEFASFQQILDQLSPPPAVRRSMKVANAKAANMKVAQKKSPAKTQPKASAVAESSPTPTIPTDVILPDRVVLTGGVR